MNMKAFLLTLCLSPLGLMAITPAPKGLTNAGNSCFMAASLQSLYAMDELVDALSNKRDYYNQNTISDTCLALLNQMVNMQARTFKPETFFNEGWQLLGARKGTQQDAGEFFYALLNRLVDEDIKDAIKNNMPLYPNAPVFKMIYRCSFTP